MQETVALEDPETPLMDGGKQRSKLKYIICIICLLIIIGLIILIVFLTKNKDSKSNRDDSNSNPDEDIWAESYKKAKEFVSKLNRTEKVNLLYGTENMRFLYPGKADPSEFSHLCVGQIDPFKNEKVDFKGMCLQDGPAGTRFVNGKSISWQSNLNLASTFNKTLMYEVGKEQGAENKEKGINTFLSPCVNIMRTPQSGRVWEAFGEDPFFSGVCAAQVIKGIQENGVIATIKHFVGNDQETYRHASSSNIDKAPLMDIYVEPFYRAIHDADVGAVMSCYNAVNDTYCSENYELLTEILRGILGFKGFVMSDWWAIYSEHENNFKSGLDMNMPGGAIYGEYCIGRNMSYWSLLEKYEDEKKINDTRITEAATRIIATMYQLGQMENFPKTDLYKDTKTDKRIELQRRAAAESQILLKNEDNILPLKSNITIAIIGNDAAERDCGTDEDMGCQNTTNKVQVGHIPLGYGSGTTTFGYLIHPLEAILEASKEKNISVEYSCNLNFTDVEGVHVEAKEDIENGVKIANISDVAIIFAKADSGEEFLQVENSIGDRKDLDLWHGANELIKKVAEVNENVIVVINAPAVVNLPWLDKVKAVIFSGFPGSESGNAIADILFGKVNPSGHLPYAWAGIDDYGTKIENITNLTIIKDGKTYRDIYRYDGVDSAGRVDDEPGHEKEQYNYTEGLYVGQRWFNKKNKKPTFPFGFGLTYTTFKYTDLKLKIGKEGLDAEFNVENIGNCSGSAVPMLFLTFPESIGEYPKYIFKGFEKLLLEPGESKNVTIKVDDHALSYFNVEQNKYVRVNNGKIKVYIAEDGDQDNHKLSDEIDSKY